MSVFCSINFCFFKIQTLFCSFKILRVQTCIVSIKTSCKFSLSSISITLISQVCVSQALYVICFSHKYNKIIFIDTYMNFYYKSHKCAAYISLNRHMFFPSWHVPVLKNHHPRLKMCMTSKTDSQETLVRMKWAV